MSLAALALLLSPIASATDPQSLTEYGDDDTWTVPFVDGPGAEGPDAVVGGRPVTGDRWDATVGVIFGGAYVGCTGTLIAPNVVITAGHCANGISGVMIGAKDWTQSGEAGVEVIDVKEVIEYPGGIYTYDIAVLRLAKKSKYPHAFIGMECTLDEYLKKGADVQIVGYGLTNESGTGFNSILNQAPAKVNDPDCSNDFDGDIYVGCSDVARPAGEITAGGRGTDACFGDSGGPLYLKTDEGDFVVGVTSRAYLGVSGAFPCRDGGVWVRPDAVFKWIEDSAKRDIPLYSCNIEPSVMADTLYAKKNRSGTVALFVDDPDENPDGDKRLFEIVQQPEFGSATVDGDGIITYTPDDGYTGQDAVTVSVTDSGANHLWKRTGDPVTTELDVDIEVGGGLFGGNGEGGCGCDSGSGAPLGWLALVGGLIGLRRRR